MYSQLRTRGNAVIASRSRAYLCRVWWKAIPAPTKRRRCPLDRSGPTRRCWGPTLDHQAAAATSDRFVVASLTLNLRKPILRIKRFSSPVNMRDQRRVSSVQWRFSCFLLPWQRKNLEALLFAKKSRGKAAVLDSANRKLFFSREELEVGTGMTSHVDGPFARIDLRVKIATLVNLFLTLRGHFGLLPQSEDDLRVRELW